ncbi:MAG: hypothetical protein FJ087_02015 [Deltaproteobacteria bacterium]|nr:hypothetical protein [Deltaproteobacteria bacterium]
MLIELLLERTLSGGSLPEGLEAARAAQLDRCWQFMTDEEQDDAERWWASSPKAPARLGSQDVKVGRGEQLLPRKAA